VPLQQVLALLQRDDRIDLGVEPLDVPEVGVHHLGAGDRARADGGGKLGRAHQHQGGRLDCGDGSRRH
jgi:hypothetical protein